MNEYFLIDLFLMLLLDLVKCIFVVFYADSSLVAVITSPSAAFAFFTEDRPPLRVPTELFCELSFTCDQWADEAFR